MWADDPRTTLPFRWNLVTPDRLGSLLDGDHHPDLWFAAELVECSAKVLGRSGGGALHFVGRSMDSMYDLLTGVLADDPRLMRLPFSNLSEGWVPHDEWREQARVILTRCGVTPFRLARTSDPVSFVDIVSTGGTFESLYSLLRGWVDEQREPWDVVRRKIRFIGIVDRRETSPKTRRWQQHAGWTAQLPSGAVSNVSMDPSVYSYLANRQEKLTGSFGPSLRERVDTRRDSVVRYALAEAVALVALGRRPETLATLIRNLSNQRPHPKKWLAALTHA
ncbi:hypothetical protein ACQPZK_26940 [Micromonospora sp. CA-249363]|uniref:hypothetical protein n=1 Tax=Micromonospora sp. CA-249363 TaxID=3239963 RepID=UPI003D90051D